MHPIHISHFTATTGYGLGTQPLLLGLQSQLSCLQPCTFDTVDFSVWAGEVPDLASVDIPIQWADYDCRNNRLAFVGLQADGFATRVQEAVTRYGANRVAVILGTSTSGLYSTELAYRERLADGALPPWFRYAQTHNSFSVADFTCKVLGTQGPAWVISTACSSSAKVFASAARLLQSGVVDAAVVGGVDSLCLTTLYGFKSLGLTSEQACRPYDASRNGISIGEAAAFALLERADLANLPPNSLLLTGYGESSDAYHMSAPHPEGVGAQTAMRSALDMAQLQASDIGYINLHGTATISNDLAEGRAVATVFGSNTPCSSTKNYTGHTLGAAGGLEAVIAALALQHGFIPGGQPSTQFDPNIPSLNYCTHNQTASALWHVMSNSFGFGGSNCSLIISRTGALQ